MTQNEMQAAAKNFAAQWLSKGDEKQETQRFWIELLGEVLGIRNPASYIEFEKRVKLSHTSFIDAYIPETKVLIEQKGIKIDLKKPYEQSDGTLLTPYEQAKRYVNDMKASEKPRWIVVCNFSEFNVYDMENPQNPPEVIFLKDLDKDFYRLEFLVDRKNENIRREEEISIAAGKLVGKMYDAIVKEYIPQGENGELTADQARSLNILCVRLVFCFYAEDAGLFATRTAFEDYLRSFNLQNVRLALINLFKALDTKIEQRDKYDTSISPFPYVNGGLFKDERIEIPNFTQEIADVLCNDCAAFNWSEISPTIFGAVFESTLNPETRRKGGMHYTSIENIHKVIDPLFMDSLNEEFEEICGTKKYSDIELALSPVDSRVKHGNDSGSGHRNDLGIKFIIDEKGERHEAKNINGYLLDAPDIFVESRSKPMCDVPEFGIGNKPIDNGNYLFDEEEMKKFIKKEPNSKKYFHKWIGADEFINGYFRYCLWLGDCPLSEIKNMKECYKRVQAVRDYRLASKSAGTRKIADKPTNFHVENMPTQNYIVIPEISSEKRYYVPIGFMTPDIMCSNRVKISQNATIYHFGILTSSVHMAWMRATCGRLEMRYCYSVNIVYNNFPWCNPTDAQKERIEKTAQSILDIRAKYPNDNLAVLYDDTLMPADLRKAHKENDRAVMQAYGFSPKATESEVVAELFKLYQKMCASFS